MTDSRSTPTHHPSETGSGTLAIVTQAARRGAADASEAASQTWEAAGRFVNGFLYTTCYTVAYGVVFPSVLLARAVPKDNPLVRGLIDGTHAAMRKTDELYRPAIESPAGSRAAALPAS
jgi:hypothetical protein